MKPREAPGTAMGLLEGVGIPEQEAAAVTDGRHLTWAAFRLTHSFCNIFLLIFAI